MDDFILIKNKKINLKTILAGQSLNYFSNDFFNQISSTENIDYLEFLLNKHEINLDKKPLYQKGFGKLSLNEEIGEWAANNLLNFLEKPQEYYELSDKIVMSKPQIATTFCALTNSLSQAENEKNYLVLWETRDLFNKQNFEKHLSPIINKNMLYELKPIIKEYFKEKEHHQKEKIYSKLDFTSIDYEERKDLIKKQEMIRNKLFAENIIEPEKEKTNSLPGQIYEEMNILKERKKQGTKLKLTEITSYLRGLNMVMQDNVLNKDTIKFLNTEEGFEFLTYEGPATDAFLRCVNKNIDLIKSFYK